MTHSTRSVRSGSLSGGGSPQLAHLVNHRLISWLSAPQTSGVLQVTNEEREKKLIQLSAAQLYELKVAAAAALGARRLFAR